MSQEIALPTILHLLWPFLSLMAPWVQSSHTRTWFSWNTKNIKYFNSLTLCSDVIHLLFCPVSHFHGNVIDPTHSRYIHTRHLGYHPLFLTTSPVCPALPPRTFHRQPSPDLPPSPCHLLVSGTLLSCPCYYSSQTHLPEQGRQLPWPLSLPYW